MRKSTHCLTVIAVLASAISALPARAQTSEPDATELAKQLSNPIASLVSIPFQFNWDQGVGPNNDVRYILNTQPVMPFQLTENVNLIGRWIVPYVSQPSLFPGGEPTSGYADILASAFFSPAKASKVSWGIGPVFSLPTTTNPLLGSGKWSMGPTVVMLTQTGPWTIGFLGNHLWSVSNTGDVERNDVNQSFLNPFVARALGKAVTLTLTTEASANWEADSGEEWTVPVSASIKKVTKLGPFPFAVSAAFGSYIESPEGGPEWKLQTAFTLILPRGK